MGIYHFALVLVTTFGLNMESATKYMHVKFLAVEEPAITVSTRLGRPDRRTRNEIDGTVS